MDRNFNPRSHKGSDSVTKLQALFLYNFNPRSHKGSDSNNNYHALLFLHFNPRSHKGSDARRFQQSSFLSLNFNPRSHKGSDNLCLPNPNVLCNFNPRSHKGSDYEGDLEMALITDISIHAPTRGATLNRFDIQVEYGISIHAPTRGATTKVAEFITDLVFQSTLPQGERLSFSVYRFNHRYFNPRSHKGSDDR